MATFQRARTAEQRATRASTIVDTAQSMLAEMPPAEITLNGLAKRAGLAPSNVLRYFDSREAVLLELVNRQTEAWLGDLLRHAPPPAADPPVARCAAVARAIAATLDAHHGFCELISVQATVLERRVTTSTVLRFKTTSSRQLERLAQWLADALPELPRAGEEGRLLRLSARMILVAGALWAQHGASEVLAEQLVDHRRTMLLPDANFPDAVRETLLLLLLGAVTESVARPRRASALPLRRRHPGRRPASAHLEHGPGRRRRRRRGVANGEGADGHRLRARTRGARLRVAGLRLPRVGRERRQAAVHGGSDGQGRGHRGRGRVPRLAGRCCRRPRPGRLRERCLHGDGRHADLRHRVRRPGGARVAQPRDRAGPARRQARHRGAHQIGPSGRRAVREDRARVAPARGRTQPAHHRPGADYYTSPERGAVPQWDNTFNPASWTHWLDYDAQAAAPLLTQPLLVVHSDAAASPESVREFVALVPGRVEQLWLSDVSQFDFYDAREPMTAAADAVAAHVGAHRRALRRS